MFWNPMGIRTTTLNLDLNAPKIKWVLGQDRPCSECFQERIILSDHAKNVSSPEYLSSVTDVHYWWSLPHTQKINPKRTIEILSAVLQTHPSALLSTCSDRLIIVITYFYYYLGASNVLSIRKVQGRDCHRIKLRIWSWKYLPMGMVLSPINSPMGFNSLIAPLLDTRGNVKNHGYLHGFIEL